MGLPYGAAAGPWSPSPGHGYAKVWLKWLPGFSYRDGAGEVHSYGAYHEVFLNAYGEIGIVRGLAATAHLPLVRIFSLADPRTDTTSNHLAPGDPTVGVRWQFLQRGGFALGANASVTVPIAPSESVQVVYGNAAGNPPVGKLQVGTGAWDLHTGISFGFARGRYYGAGSIGAVARSAGFDDVVTWSAEGGARFGARWSLRLRLLGWHALANGDAVRSESPSGVGNGTSYTGAVFEADYRFSGAWVFGWTLEGALGYYRRQTGGPVLSVYAATTF